MRSRTIGERRVGDRGPGQWRRRRVGARRRGRREDGQALIEFTLLLPILLLILTAILQFGLMFNKYLALTDAVRAGARELAIGRGLDDPCDPAVAQTVNSALTTGLTSGQVTTTLASPDSCGSGTYPNRTGGSETQGNQATVSVSYPYSFTIFGVWLFNLNLTASASDAIE